MTDTNNELKACLKVAEQKLEDLFNENQELARAYQDNIDAQMAETEQMVQLTEQIWKLEEALAMSQEKAMAQLQKMKGKFNEVQAHMQETLKAASDNASRMELAARVYEMSTVAKIDEIDEQLTQFNETLTPGKLE